MRLALAEEGEVTLLAAAAGAGADEKSPKSPVGLVGLKKKTITSK